MSRLVTIFGGSGFLGRYVANRMAKEGWRVRVATRRPNEAMFVKPYGTVGQVEPVLCNIRDEASVASALHGADAVVNCVGILTEIGANSFEAVHVEGAGRIARLAADAGVANLVHISSIGADETAVNDFGTSKAKGEAAVLVHYPEAVILRPSVLFGAEDRFFNKLAMLTNIRFAVPLAAAGKKFQPVYVDDVAKAAVLGATGKANGVYELGGPEAATLGELFNKTLEIVHRKRVIMDIPRWQAIVVAFKLDILQKISMGLFANRLLTRDQVRGFSRDYVVSEGARGFAELGIEPMALETILPDYLWRFRPSGQYDAIKRSAFQ